MRSICLIDMRVRVILYGDVRGVFCRQAIKKKAESFEVAGQVRNKEDGSVEVILEGEKKNVEAMIEFCKKNPGYSTVEQSEVFEEEDVGLKGFRIVQ